jgi:hypothetical protein
MFTSSQWYPGDNPNTKKCFYLHSHCVYGCSYSEMKVTLWGQRAAAFTTDGVYDSTQAKPIVVLFVGGLMKSYQSMFYLLVACLVVVHVPLELNFFVCLRIY